MAGDKMDMAVRAWVPVKPDVNDETPVTPEDILTALLSAASGKTAILSNKATAVQLGTTGGSMYLGIQSFLASHPAVTDGESPRAYLNWILFDEQFKYVPEGSGFKKVNFYLDRRLQTLAELDFSIPKSGYFFVFLTNETNNKYTFFDNLVVQHYTGPLTECNDYTAWGLGIKALESRAFGKVENKRKYNGIEFEKDFDIDTYDAQFRELNTQIALWWQPDPKIEEGAMDQWSPYVSMYDNPIRYEDHLGDVPCCPGAMELWQAVKSDAVADGPEIGSGILVGGAIIVGVVAIGEFIYDVATHPTYVAPPVPGGLGIPGYNPITQTYTPSGQTQANSTSTTVQNKTQSAQSSSTTAQQQAPPPNNGDGKKHGGNKHNEAIENKVGQLKRDESYGDGVRNIRKNQSQTDVNGKKVGNNRPDVQYDQWNPKTKKWEHHNVEYDNNSKNSKNHGSVLKKNDPKSKVELNIL